MHIHELLRYWRNCLADGELSAPHWKKNQEIESISFEALTEGQIDVGPATRIVDAVEDRLNRKRRKPESRQDREDRWTIDSAQVVIAPFRLRRNVEHGQNRYQDRQTHAPFWIAARLRRNGSLMPTEGRAAWFVREYLDPSGTNDAVVGKLDAMDSFLARSPTPLPAEEAEPSAQWSRWVQWVGEFFAAVTGEALEGFRLEGYATLDGARMMPHSQMTGVGRHLLELYDAVLPEPDEAAGAKTSTRLLDALADPKTPTAFEPEPSLEAPIRQNHRGHMNESFGLGPSQRESLHALLRLQDGEMLALNGPPGTGKTVWIQSVVASLWVERALAGGEPPIIVATSANNRAVTNILDTFHQASPPGASGLAERWLPKIDTYGLFLPSESQSLTTEHRWATPGHPEWSGLPPLMEQHGYLEESERHFLDRARSYYGARYTEIEAVVGRLHEDLRATSDRIATLQTAGEDLRRTRRSRPEPSPRVARERLAEPRAAARAFAEKVEALAREVDAALASVPLAEELLSFLSPIRDRRNDRFERLFQRHDLPAPNLSRWSYRQILRAALGEHRETAATRLAEVEASLASVELWEKKEQEWAARLAELLGILDSTLQASARIIVEAATNDPRAVEPLVDQTLRRRLFLLAGRYWEGRWLLELRSILEDPDPKKLHRKSRGECLQRFRRFAKVTPLFVSTVYMLPKFFTYYWRGRHPMIEDIDLLMVEEAGQVAPELGGALFALAKKAVVLGDVFQIEPIWSLGHMIDDANRERHRALAFRQEAFHSSRGSLMAVARARTRFTNPSRVDGLWLREHRRCVPGVITYCRELVPAYRNMLEPHRPEISDRELPALGWAHVRSESRRSGSSWSNEGQAQMIARWIMDRRESLEATYKRPIGEILGVVTPYRAQATTIRRSLRSVGLAPSLEIGTVLTFQGGEMPVMLFSPVVTVEHQGTHFFDRNINMLNVAVSRARDSFLVFGDMRAFDATSSRPSGLLARFLLAEESNQLPDVDAEPELLRLPEVERISGLEEHRQVLREAFEQARQKLLIVSPYLTRNAVDADHLLERIATTRAQVCIAYSIDMARTEAQEVAERLDAAGAEVIRLRGFHTKTLAVDNSWFTHGSFNWLSAVRQAGGRFQYREASIRCGPPKAPDAISEIWEEIDTSRVS